MIETMSHNLSNREKMSVMLMAGGAIGITGFLLTREYGAEIWRQVLKQQWFTLILVAGVASLSGFLRWKYQKRSLGLLAWYINIAAGFVFAATILTQSQFPPAFGFLIMMLQIGIHYSAIVAADHFSVGARAS